MRYLGALSALIGDRCPQSLSHEWGVLSTWTPGMQTVDTMFANNVDFYLSFRHRYFPGCGGDWYLPNRCLLQISKGREESRRIGEKCETGESQRIRRCPW